MAEAIITRGDGQSIPAALAAARPPRKVRKAGNPAPQAGKTAELIPAPVAPAPVIVPEPIMAAPQPEPEPVVAITSPEPVSTPPAAVLAAPTKESIMATTIENMNAGTAKAQAFFTDAGERAKGAVAKSTKMFEEATAAFKTLASVKSPTEFMKLQSDFVRGAFDAMVAETSRSTETMLKLAGEVAQPISNRMAVAAEKMKTPA